jgi:hypothetical protein
LRIESLRRPVCDSIPVGFGVDADGIFTVREGLAALLQEEVLRL